MKSNRKKISLGVFGLVSLLSALFITAAPGTGVSAQTTPDPVAATAAVFLAFAQTSSGANSPVITVDVDSQCNNAIGGTLHNASMNRESVTLGPTNAQAVSVVTHTNTSPLTRSATDADPCDIDVTLTSNLNCTLSATAGIVPLIAGTLGNKLTSSITGAKSASFTLSGAGATEVSLAGEYFTPATAGGLLALNPIPAKGELVSGSTALVESDMAVITILVGASSCDNPIATRLAINNAEPSGSVHSVLTIMPNSECQPGTSFGTGELQLVSGSPGEFQGSILNPDCTYLVTVGIDLPGTFADDKFDINSAGLKTQCGLEALVYRIVNGSTLEVTKITPEDKIDANRLTYVGNDLILTRAGAVLAGRVVQITTYITADCPTIAMASFTFGTIGTALAVAKSTIVVKIVPAPGSASGCIATPASISIKGSGKSTTSALIERPRGGRACSYVITYPEAAGALSLVHENGGNLAVAAQVGPPAVAAVALVTHTDDDFDGVITASALTLRNTETTAVYTTRNLPISVSMNFDNDLVFTTLDSVAYRIAVTGVCARFEPIIARALGQTGTFRSVQAYPGTTIILDKTLASSEQKGGLNVSGPLLTEIPPVVIVGGSPRSCTLEVEEISTPVGCTVVGDNPREVTFSTGSNGFIFEFEHSCPGAATRNTISRRLTG